MFMSETISSTTMRLNRTSVFVCALALTPLCVARTREDEITAEIVGPHFSSLPDDIIPSKPKPPEPEKPFVHLSNQFAILSGGRHRDWDSDCKPCVTKNVRDDPWWWDRKSQRPPKNISPKGSFKQRRPNAVRRR